MVKKNYHSGFAHSKGVAKAIAKNRPVSLKYSTEIAREIKGIPLNAAEKFVRDVAEKKRFLPLRRYHKKVPHRRGNSMSFTKSGRYPVKTAKAFLELLETVKANADYAGLDAEKLLIKDVFASQGFARIGYQPQGRISGKARKRKSTHLEIVVMEAK